jgi:Rrf2 family protein
MDVLRRNTDYALRAMLNLTKHYEDEPVSTRILADEEQIPYQLGCKLMQRLHDAKLVKSCMGPKGGFRLGRQPLKINLLEVIEVMQGAIRLNRCLLGLEVCERRKSCVISSKLAELQEKIRGYLAGVTLDKLAQSRATEVKQTTKRSRRKRQ